jgi:hypothetical protein
MHHTVPNQARADGASRLETKESESELWTSSAKRSLFLSPRPRSPAGQERVLALAPTQIRGNLQTIHATFFHILEII